MKGGTASPKAYILKGCLLYCIVLLRNLDVSNTHVALAHDICILIDEDEVPDYDASVDVRVVCSVPVGTRCELVVSLHDILDARNFAFTVDYVDCMLAKSCAGRVTIAVSPSSEASCTALVYDCLLDFCKNCREVTRFFGKVDSKSSRIAHER